MLSTYTGSFAANTSTGNQTISGLPFAPKIVLFWVTSRTSDGTSLAAELGFGVGVSSTNRRSTAAGLRNSLAGSYNVGGHDNTKCIYFLNSSAGVMCAADMVSLNADGFTVNWTTADATARKVLFLCLGGDDLTNVTTGQFQKATTTGNQAVTGVGYQGDSILFFNFRNTSTAPVSNSSSTSPRWGLGWGKSSTARGHSRARGDTSHSHDYQRTTSLWSTIDDGPSSNNIMDECDLVSFGADGFTVNWTTSSANARHVFYIVLKGGQVAIGSFNQATSTGNFSVTGLPFQGTGLVLLSRGKATGSTVTAGAQLDIGAATDSSNRFAIATGSTDSGTADTAGTNIDATKILKAITPNGASSSVVAAVDFVSFNADGFTLNQTTADATARETLYMLLGSNAATSLIKKVAGVPIASVKKISGIAIASVKKIAGVNNV